MVVIGQINEHYGLSEAQIGMLSSQRQAMLFRLSKQAAGVTGLLVLLLKLKLIGFDFGAQGGNFDGH